MKHTYGNQDTIAAIATGMTNAGISIIRISGEDAVKIADRIYAGKQRLEEVPSHTIHYGYIKNGEERVDQVLVTVMKGPRTFTGEDTVEINCHGGLFVTKKILELVFAAGARSAMPGEFTKRAFLNGKMDLSQAEAVMDLIQSDSDAALRTSVSQLQGKIGQPIRKMREEILYYTAWLEAYLDDPEHIDVKELPEKLLDCIDRSIRQISDLVASFENGRLLREGIKTVIIGKPNAGKSSLMNRLAKEEKAIVTNVPGTTRDVVEEHIRIGQAVLRVMDTAGIREARDLAEQLGVEKAKQLASEADLILYVADGLEKPDEEDLEILKSVRKKKVMILLNKMDLWSGEKGSRTKHFASSVWDMHGEEPFALPKDWDIMEISALDGSGISMLEEKIAEKVYGGDIRWDSDTMITNIRHKEELVKALESLRLVKKSVEDEMPEDFFTIDLMDAYSHLGYIIGENMGEDLADEIFGKFCMGK